jgi:predicted glycosyltransferase
VNPKKKNMSAAKKIWIDLDNSPHVPFFVPIVEALRAQGHEVIITARDAYQVCDLIKYYGLPARVVGRHYGKSKILKLLGTCWRTLQLAAIMKRQKPDIAVSHGSRGCMLASKVMNIKGMTIADYEFAGRFDFMRTPWAVFPEVIPDDRLVGDGITILKYPGIKEDVYLSRFRPDPELRKRIGVSPSDLLITVRPPAGEAHYHNPESEALLAAVLNRFSSHPNARVLLLPRNKRQENELRAAWAEKIASGKILFPPSVEDGLNIIWNSDVVVSGGGTMNREAAAMGVPVYSIFRGAIGAVDRYLVDQGRLTLLENVDDVKTKIKAVWRQKSEPSSAPASNPALETIVGYITSIAALNGDRSAEFMPKTEHPAVVSVEPGEPVSQGAGHERSNL